MTGPPPAARGSGRQKSRTFSKAGEHLGVVAHEQKRGARSQGTPRGSSLSVSRALRWSRLPVGSSARTSFGPLGQRPGHGHPLLLAGGELARVSGPGGGKGRRARGAPGRWSRSAPAAECHPEQDVLEAGVALEQVEGLEDVADGGGAQPVAARARRGPPCRPGRSGSSPESGDRIPAIRLRNVVLPDPLSPRSATCSPTAIAKSLISTIGLRIPSGPVKDFRRPLTWRSVGGGLIGRFSPAPPGARPIPGARGREPSAVADAVSQVQEVPSQSGQCYP